MLFILGLVIFLGAHLFSGVLRGPRDQVVAAIGAGPYRGVFSLLSLAGFILIIIGWSDADRTVIYATPYWLRHITYLLMLLSLILLASAYLPAGRIAAAAKHPMLAGVKLWAFAHLLVNGDVRSLLLFGGFLAFAVIDRIALKKRNAPTRQAASKMNDLVAMGVGVVAWLAIYLFLHPYIAGVPISP